MSGYNPDNFSARPLVIAVDFDETITADTGMWIDIIGLMRARGHKVYVVTFRHDVPEKNKDMEFIKEHVDGVYFTGYTQKRRYMSVAQHIHVDIWCDDMPELIP